MFLVILSFYFSNINNKKETAGAGSVYYVPVVPPRGSIRGPHPPHYVRHPVNQAAPTLPPETLALRTNIINQIEYYFR